MRERPGGGETKRTRRWEAVIGVSRWMDGDELDDCNETPSVRESCAVSYQGEAGVVLPSTVLAPSTEERQHPCKMYLDNNVSLSTAALRWLL